MKRWGILATALFLSTASMAMAGVTCSNSGSAPNPVDPSLAPKILDWAAKTEATLGLSPASWLGVHAKVADREQAATLDLQAAIGEWAMAVPPDTSESIFRSALVHGGAVQYETLMIGHDPANADKHKFWADVEAARAAACLSLIGAQ